MEHCDVGKYLNGVVKMSDIEEVAPSDSEKVKVRYALRDEVGQVPP